MRSPSPPKIRLSLSLDSELKAAVLQTAALNLEKPATIITRALADYLEQRRAESPTARAATAESGTHPLSKQPTKTNE